MNFRHSRTFIKCILGNNFRIFVYSVSRIIFIYNTDKRKIFVIFITKIFSVAILFKLQLTAIAKSTFV